jgi:hypothetical protein
MKHKSPPMQKPNTRAQARSLFPLWSRTMQAKWVLSRLRTNSGTWAFPVGERHQGVPDYAPDFLRLLPRDGLPLETRAGLPQDSKRDKVRRGLRFVSGLIK